MDWLSHLSLFLPIRSVIRLTSVSVEFYECRHQCLLAYQRFLIPRRFWSLKALEACKRFYAWQRYRRIPLMQVVNMPLTRDQVRLFIYMYKRRRPKGVRMLKRYRAKALRNRVMWKIELWCK